MNKTLVGIVFSIIFSFVAPYGLISISCAT